MKHFNHVLAVLAFIPLLSQAQKSKLQMTSDRRFVYSEKIINTTSGEVTLKKGSPPYNPAELATVSGAIYYVRDNEPWNGESNNIALLNKVFGKGNYTVADYSIDPNVLFSSGTSVVYLEGSDHNALALSAFLTASNLTLAENWVSAGGRLFINAAPNEGGNIDFGFGGTLLNFDDGSFLSGTGESVPGEENHPIFNGPFSPVGTSWTGDAFAHAFITGGSSTPLIMGDFGTVLSELSYGSGIVLFGGLTTANFDEPQPEANNLRANIYAYLVGGVICSAPTNLRVTNITDGSAKLHWVAEAGVSHVNIRYRKVGTNQWTLRRNVTRDAITISNLRANTTYQWQVRSCCANNIKSSWIAGDNFRTKAQAPLSISAVTVDDSKKAGNTNIQVTPNPNRGSFTIQIKLPAKGVSTTLSLYSSTGQKMWQENEGNISGSLYKNISLENKLSTGVYQLMVQRNDIKLVQKVVVIK